jgi:membrane-associated phospholipid phosphatase
LGLIATAAVPLDESEHSIILPRTGKLSSICCSNKMEKTKKLNSGLLLLGALLVAVSALFTFGWLAEEMLEGDAQKFDSVVRNAVHQHATPALTRLMQAFSFLGSVAMVSALCLVLLGAFLYFHRTRLAALLGVTMVGMGALDEALKIAFRRPRPVAFFGPTPSSYSFPSGHAFGALCFYGVLAVILTTRVRGAAAKWSIWTGAAFLIAMIGFSRIYLGVHYPSDVIAGYCAGAVWVAAVGLVDGTLLDPHKKDMNVRESPEA